MNTDKIIAIHTFDFSPKDNGGETLTLQTAFRSNGDPGLSGIYTEQKLTLQSYCNSASIELYGIQITPEKLRQLADELEVMGRDPTELISGPKPKPKATDCEFEEDSDGPYFPLKEDSVKKLNSKNWSKEVLNAKLPVLVDFSAEWCGPCKQVAPLIQKLASERKDLKVGAVDVDESTALCNKYNVASVPTLLIFWKGKQIGREIGGMPKKDLDKFVKDTMAKVK